MSENADRDRFLSELLRVLRNLCDPVELSRSPIEQSSQTVVANN